MCAITFWLHFLEYEVRAMCFIMSVMVCTSRFTALVGLNSKIIETQSIFVHIFVSFAELRGQN